MKKHLLLLVALIAPSVAFGQAYSLFQPANGVLKGSTSTFVTTPATSSDIISLWTGTCSSTTFLRGDGQCLSPGGAGIGTVTSVGLAWTGSGLTVSNSPVVSSGTLTFSGALNVATGGTGATTLTGLLKGNGTSAFSAAASSDVISLWTGTCNTTTFLRGDGSCQTIPGNTDASTLTTGTLADARLSTNIPRLNGSSNNFSGGAVGGAGGSYAISFDNTKYIGFKDSAGLFASAGFIGVNVSNQLVLGAGNGTQFTISGADTNILSTTLRHLGNNVLNTTSALNGSNVTSGTVADARLTSNVALRNTANTFTNSSGTTFTAVGNSSVSFANSSTGFITVGLNTNGVGRGDLCTSTNSSQCSSGDTANDVALRSATRVVLAPAFTAAAIVSNSSADFNVPMNVQGSAVRTVANVGRFASGRVSGAGSLSNGFGVSSVSRVGVGVYNIDLTASGMSAPNCTATANNNTSDAHPSINYGVGAVISVSMYNSGFSTSDYSFSFVCQGT